MITYKLLKNKLYNIIAAARRLNFVGIARASFAVPRILVITVDEYTAIISLQLLYYIIPLHYTLFRYRSRCYLIMSLSRTSTGLRKTRKNPI